MTVVSVPRSVMPIATALAYSPQRNQAVNLPQCRVTALITIFTGTLGAIARCSGAPGERRSSECSFQTASAMAKFQRIAHSAYRA